MSDLQHCLVIGAYFHYSGGWSSAPAGSKCPPLAAPQLGSCTSSGRAWRLWAARHSQEEANPLGAQPLPRVLELAASKAADFTALWPSRHTEDGVTLQWVFPDGCPGKHG